MVIDLKLLVTIIIILPWIRGGVLETDTFYTILVTFATCIFIVIMCDRKKLRSKQTLLFSTVYVVYILIGSNNNIFKANFEDLDRITKSLDFNLHNKQINEIADIVNQSKSQVETDQRTALYLIFNTLNQLKFKFSEIDKSSLIVIDYLIFHFTVQFSPYLPSITEKKLDYFLKYVLILLTSILSFTIYRKKSFNSHFFSKIVLYNCLILLILGILAKMNWGINYETIMGFWNIPDKSNAFSTFVYKNHWATFALLSLCHGIATVISHGKKYKNVNNLNILSLIICIVIISLSLFFIESRSSICFFVLTVFMIFLFILKFKNRFFIFVITITSVLFIFYGKIDNVSFVQRTVSQISQLKDGNMPFRFLLWKDSLNQISSKTFYGYGIDSYFLSNPIFQSNDTVTERYKITLNAHQEFTPVIKNTHSDILQTLIEHGFISFAFFLFPLFFLILRRYILTYSYYTKTLCVGFLVYLLYCFVDLPNKSLANFFLASATVGMIFKPTYDSSKKKNT